ncbi:MAG TPA: FixH family protein [Nitrosopumilaceae archaeon]|nr:FixH family protein [Nitrosopumilaceae archaeon]
MFNKFILVGIALGVVALGIFAVNSYGYCMTGQNSGMMQSMMGNGMMSGMMSDVPQDVTIKIISRQQVSVGKESQITLLVLDKNTNKPLDDAQVIVGIEKGAPMSTMDMSGMFTADNIGNGKYVVRFTLEDAGYYTLHTHIIPSGKSMHSMMNNHVDIGIIAK